MKINQLTLFTLLAPSLAVSFFSDSKSDKVRADLQALGEDLLDQTGQFKDSVFEKLDPADLKEWIAAHTPDEIPTDEAVAYAKQHKDWFVDDLKDYFGNTKDNANAILSKGAKYYEQAASVGSDQAHSAVDYVNENVGDAVEQGQKFLNNLKDTVLSEWSDSDIRQFLSAHGVENTQKWTRDQLLELGEHIKSLVNSNGGVNVHGWKAEAEAQVNEAKKQAKKSNNELDGIVSKLNKAGADFQNSVSQLAKKLVGTTESTKKAGENKIKEFIKSYDELYERFSDNLYYYVSGQYRKKKDPTVGERIGGAFKAAKDKVGSLSGVFGFYRNDL